MNNGMVYPYMQNPFNMTPNTPGCSCNNEVKVLENKINKLEQRLKRLEDVVFQSPNNSFNNNYDTNNYSMM